MGSSTAARGVEIPSGRARGPLRSHRVSHLVEDILFELDAQPVHELVQEAHHHDGQHDPLGPTMPVHADDERLLLGHRQLARNSGRRLGHGDRRELAVIERATLRDECGGHLLRGRTAAHGAGG